MILTIIKQLREVIRKLVHISGFVIPPKYAIAKAIASRLRQQYEFIPSAIIANHSRRYGETSPLLRRGCLADYVIASPLETFPVAVIQDGMQPPGIGSRTNLTAVVATHLGNVA